MGFLNLFSSKKTVDKVVDGAMSGIDKLFYTKEEQADTEMKKMEVKLKIAEGVQKFVESTLDENTARSRTRRVIAIMIMGVFLLLVLGAATAYLFDKDYSQFLFDIVGDVSTFALMVAGFFFGAHLLGRDVINKKKKK